MLEVLAARAGAQWRDAGGLRARVADVVLAGQSCLLLAPQTFMNRSGESVRATLARHPELVPERDLVVVYDDLDLPPGRLRLRPEGRAGGHRGLADIVRVLASEAIPRLRFGIGHPGSAEAVVDWVLQPFSPLEETDVLSGALERAADALVCVVGEGMSAAMSRFNSAA